MLLGTVHINTPANTKPACTLILWIIHLKIILQFAGCAWWGKFSYHSMKRGVGHFSHFYQNQAQNISHYRIWYKIITINYNSFQWNSCQSGKRESIRGTQISVQTGVGRNKLNPASQSLDRIKLFTFNIVEMMRWNHLQNSGMPIHRVQYRNRFTIL